MDHKEFIDLVANMRRAQKEYFEHRTNAALSSAKSLERKVDKVLAEGIRVDTSGSQGVLFAGTEDTPGTGP